MAQVGSEPGGSFLAAWRGLSDNPLPRLWALAGKRGFARRGAWFASPFFWGLALVSALTTLLLILNLQDFLGWRESVIATRGFCLARIGYALALIMLGGMAAAALWLLARVHALAGLALGLLSNDRANPAALDGLLTMSPLSGREIVAALAYHALRSLAPPLAALAACQAAACALLIACAGQFHSGPGQAWLKLLAIGGTCSGHFLLALASGVCLALYLLIAGRALKSPVAAETGAALAVLAAAAGLAWGPVAVLRTLSGGWAASGVATAWFTCLGLLAVMGYLLILALEWRPARLILLALLPLSLISLAPTLRPTYGMLLNRSMSSRGMRFGGARLNLTETAVLDAANPLSVISAQETAPLLFAIYENVPYSAEDSPLDRYEQLFGTAVKVLPLLAKAAGLSLLVLAGRILVLAGLAALALLALAGWRRELGTAGDTGPAQGGAQGRSARGSPRACAVAWICLALPPLAMLCVIAGFALAHQPRLVNTGDALLDAWLGILVERGAIVHQYGNYSHQMPTGTMLTDRDWATLKARFGKDPRFYLLRYRERVWTEPEYRSATAGIELQGGVRFLEEARQLGAADASVLLALLTEYEMAWNEALCEELAPRHMRPKQKEDKLAFARQVAAELKRRYGKVEAGLTGELMRAGGDQAEVHGFLAVLAYERGDSAGALKEIRLANAAPRNATLAGFPAENLTRGLAAGRYLAGDARLTGALCADWISIKSQWGYSYILGCQYHYAHYMMADSLSHTAARAGDSEVLGEVVRFGCRRGAAEGASTLRVMTGMDLAGIVPRAVTAAYIGDLSVGQQQALGKLKGCLSSPFSSGAYRRSTGSSGVHMLATRSERLMLWLRMIATFGASEYRELTGEDGKLAIDEAQAFAGEVRKAAAEAERFDYSTLIRSGDRSLKVDVAARAADSAGPIPLLSSPGWNHA